MAENEVGKGYVSIEPDAKGFGSKTERAVNAELSGVGGKAGQKLGSDLGDGIGDGVNRSLPKAKGGVKGFVDDITGSFAAIPLPVLGAGAAIGAFAVSAINAASDLNEEISKTGVTFGEAAGSIRDFAAGAADSLGQSEAQALTAANTFGVLFTALGKSKTEAAGMSVEMVQLATDLASFNNTSVDEAIQAIGAALRGESEPIRRFGVLLDDATLRSEALADGLIETSRALTPQERAMAAYSVILKQTTSAQGDFARTQDGMANQSKILNASVENLQANIGQVLLPAVTQLITEANQLIGPLAAVSGWLDKIGAFEAPSFSFVGDILGASLGPLGMIFGTAAEGISKVNEVQEKEKKAREEANAAWNASHGSLRAFEGDAVAVGTAIENVSRAVPHQVESLRAYEDGVGNIAEAYERAQDAANNYLTAVMAVEDSALAQEVAVDRVGDSIRDMEKAWGAATEAVKKNGEGSSEAVEAQDAAADAARGLRGDVLGVAAAALKAAEDQAALSGATLTAEQRAGAQIDALRTLKAQYPQVGDQVDDLIAKINATPPAKTTTVTVTDNGSTESVQQRIKNLYGITVGINVIGNFSDFDRNMAARAAASRTKVVADGGAIVPGRANQAVPATVHGGEVILNAGQQAEVLWAIANGAGDYDSAATTSSGGTTVVIERVYGTVDRAFMQQVQGGLLTLERERR